MTSWSIEAHLVFLLLTVTQFHALVPYLHPTENCLFKVNTKDTNIAFLNVDKFLYCSLVTGICTLGIFKFGIFCLLPDKPLLLKR